MSHSLPLHSILPSRCLLMLQSSLVGDCCCIQMHENMAAYASGQTFITISIITRFFYQKRPGASADKLQVKAKYIPLLVGLARSKQDPINRGHSTYYFTVHRQPGQDLIPCPIYHIRGACMIECDMLQVVCGRDPLPIIEQRLGRGLHQLSSPGPQVWNLPLHAQYRSAAPRAAGGTFFMALQSILPGGS